MRSTTRISVLAMAAACGWAVPAHAQEGEAAAIQQELAAMRAQMAEMAARMDALQSEGCSGGSRRRQCRDRGRGVASRGTGNRG